MIMIPRIPRIPKFFMGSALVRHPIRIPIRGCLLRIRSTSCRMLRLHHGAMQLEMMEIFNLQWMSILQLESGSYRSIYRFIIWYNDLYVQVVFRIIQISKNITSRDTPNPHIWSPHCRWLLPSLREAHGQNLGLLPVTWSTWKTSVSKVATEAERMDVAVAAVAVENWWKMWIDQRVLKHECGDVLTLCADTCLSWDMLDNVW